jgi:hypothetical protein
MLTLGVGEHGCVGCFSLLVLLIAPEETEEPASGFQRAPFTAAAAKDDEAWEHYEPSWQ